MVAASTALTGISILAVSLEEATVVPTAATFTTYSKLGMNVKLSVVNTYVPLSRFPIIIVMLIASPTLN